MLRSPVFPQNRTTKKTKHDQGKVRVFSHSQENFRGKMLQWLAIQQNVTDQLFWSLLMNNRIRNVFYSLHERSLCKLLIEHYDNDSLVSVGMPGICIYSQTWMLPMNWSYFGQGKLFLDQGKAREFYFRNHIGNLPKHSVQIKKNQWNESTVIK